MMHPNWLLLAFVLSLWGPLSLQATQPAERFARGFEGAAPHVGWQQIEAALVCSEGDPLAAECG